MKVYRVPAYSPHAVAEHAVALILSLNRKIHKAYNRVRDFNFSLSRLQGFNIYGKTVGVMGTGKIGGIFADIMQGFGCEILLWDKYQNQELIDKGMRYVELGELLAQSDIISLHIPLFPETTDIFNSQTFKMMKKGVMLINTSRGGLINTKEALAALKDGSLGSLGIDVYDQEDGIFFNNLSDSVIDDDTLSVLLSYHNVLITSHQAFFTIEALDEIAKTSIDNMKDFMDGIENDNIVKLP
jgi:D-lactate dehydrogenase